MTERPEAWTLNLAVLGALRPHDGVDRWLESAPLPVPLFAGTMVPFVLQLEALGAEIFPGEIATAVAAFLALDGRARSLAADRAFGNYREFLDIADIDELAAAAPGDIWKFIQPQCVYVSRRHRRDRDVYVSIVCACDWEIEHGLQFVFRRGADLVRVSGEDGHLTDADAYDRDDLEV